MAELEEGVGMGMSCAPIEGPWKASHSWDSPFPGFCHAHPSSPGVGTPLTNASEEELRGGHRDLPIWLIVRDRNLWRQHAEPVGALKTGAGPGPRTRPSPLTLASHLTSGCERDRPTVLELRR